MSVKDPLGGLGRARVALGCVFLLRTTPLLAAFHIPFLADANPLLGWPDGHARFAPFIPALPGALLAVLCVVRTLAAFAFTVGVRARVAGLVAGGLGYLTVLQDPARFYTTHHVIFLGTILLACTDAVSTCAVSPAPRRSPRSSLLLIRAWVASIYAWAAIAKMRPDWLDGRTFVLLAREGLLRQCVAATLLSSEPVRAFVACGTVAAEIALAIALIVRRSRRVALVVAIVFHLGLEWATSPDLFGWAMIALLLAFLDPVELSEAPHDGHAAIS
jgi:vitamin K-dependent gamma-carboxylase-like protein